MEIFKNIVLIIDYIVIGISSAIIIQHKTKSKGINDEDYSYVAYVIFWPVLLCVGLGWLCVMGLKKIIEYGAETLKKEKMLRIMYN